MDFDRELAGTTERVRMIRRIRIVGVPIIEILYYNTYHDSGKLSVKTGAGCSVPEAR